jgi:hypothetical protein
MRIVPAVTSATDSTRPRLSNAARSACLALVLAATACGERAEPGSSLSPDAPFAEGVQMRTITFNQGAGHVLRDTRYGKPFGQPYVVEDREGLLRLMLDVDEATWEPRQIAAVVDFEGTRGSERFVHTLTVEGDSLQGDLDSTFDIPIPGRLVHEGSFYTVSLHEVDATVDPDAPRPAPTDDDPWFDLRDEPWDVRPTGAMHLRIIPVVVGGRAPDTSPGQIAAFTDAMRGMYPVSDIRVDVGEPMTWGSTLAPSGAGWSTLLADISARRGAEADLAPNTYFYGLFAPAASEQEFCAGGGCVLGLSNFGTIRDVDTRASIGVGWSGALAVETMVHEIGHAHGREHAPCGGAQGVDPAFPHSNARLGTYGYDITSDTLIDPSEAADMMGYCSPIWVSDYTWFHLAERTAALNQPTPVAMSVAEPRYWQRYAVEIDGSVVPVGEPTLRRRAPVGTERTIVVEDARGSHTEVATWFPSSHLDGAGMLLRELPSDGGLLDAVEDAQVYVD